MAPTVSAVLVAAGGLGLFMLGMLIMTEGLKGLAGNHMRRWLARHTSTPATGAISGALTTALIQSSSATTVMAVGFVGAGLLTFPQSLGVIFGANIGTTITGWIVAIGGFKLDLGYTSLPLLLIGVMLRMFAGGRTAHVGWALAGFSLLFVGIATIQDGLAPFQGMVTPDDFPPDTYFGRFLLVLIGIGITLVTQSSSAGVATALVALSTGAISFPQAAALVIGMDVGTTFTAVLATVGGSTAMRQTGYAHMIYNFMTGIVAFLLLGPATEVIGMMLDSGRGDAQIGLVAFHSFFNFLGVLLILPLTGAFARLITRLVPEEGAALTERLDKRLLSNLDAASDATIATLRDMARATLTLLKWQITAERPVHLQREELNRLLFALDQTQQYVGKMQALPESNIEAYQRLDHALHSLDHLGRLLHRCSQWDRIETLPTDRRLTRLSRLLVTEIEKLDASGDWHRATDRFDRLREIFRRQRRSYRANIVARASRSGGEPTKTLEKLDSLRWLHRVSYHSWRIIVHLEASRDLADNGATLKNSPIKKPMDQ